MELPSEPVRTIAIVLGDNYFGCTFQALLETVSTAISYWSKPLRREVLTALIMEGINFHYRAFQLGNGLGEPGYQDPDRIEEYLSKIKILYNEEAEKDMDGGAWYLEVVTGRVYFY